MRVAVAFDHRGVRLRERLLEELAALGHETVDLGTNKSEPRIDYPDKAREVAEAIRLGAAERALFVCGSGVGAAVAANKAAGIRAAICHDTYSAHQGVEHDDMNVLCIGSEVVGPELVVVPLALGHRLLEDGRVRRDAAQRVVLHPRGERAGLEPAARERVDPDGLALFGDLM